MTGAARLRSLVGGTLRAVGLRRGASAPALAPAGPARAASPAVPPGYRFAFTDKAGREHVLNVPAAGRPDRPSFHVFSLHKAGSTLLDNIVIDLARAAGVVPMGLMYALFERGVHDQDVPASLAKLFRPTGYGYVGFRYLPWQFAIPKLEGAPKILLVRDPRDMLVSLYHSVAESHRPPGAEGRLKDGLAEARVRAKAGSIDAFCLEKAGYYAKILEDYKALPKRHLSLFRYEDVIYDKAAWTRAIADALALDVPEAARARIAKAHDLIPTKEATSRHVRQVHPGNHKAKLDPATIEALNAAFAPALARYGYAA